MLDDSVQECRFCLKFLLFYSKFAVSSKHYRKPLTYCIHNQTNRLTMILYRNIDFVENFCFLMLFRLALLSPPVKGIRIQTCHHTTILLRNVVFVENFNI